MMQECPFVSVHVTCIFWTDIPHSQLKRVLVLPRRNAPGQSRGVLAVEEMLQARASRRRTENDLQLPLLVANTQRPVKLLC